MKRGLDDVKDTPGIICVEIQDCRDSSIANLISSFFSHIIFMREQSTQPLKNATSSILLDGTKVNNIDDDSRKNKIDIKKKKEMKMSDYFMSINQELQEICSQYWVGSACVTIGPTLTSPREAYRLELPDYSQKNFPPINACEVSSKTTLRDIRRLIQQLIGHWSEAVFPTIPITNSFLALNVTPKAFSYSPPLNHDELMITLNNNNNNNFHMKPRPITASSSCFARRETLKIKPRKHSPPLLRVLLELSQQESNIRCPVLPNNNKDINGDDAESVVLPMKKDDNSNGIIETTIHSFDNEISTFFWLVQKKGLKGFRSKKSSIS